jgi:hypothetical protein
MRKLFDDTENEMPVSSLPDPRRRAARTGALRSRRGLAAALVVLAIGLPLAACGKKGAPQPPPGEPDTYPRVYPRE